MFQDGSSVVFLCLFVGSDICVVCFVLLYSSFLFLLMLGKTVLHDCYTLRKHAYSNMLNISPPKTESFLIKILIFFHISAQNIDCEYSLEPPHRGGSNEYPLSIFLSRNKKNNVCPCKSHFYYIKVGFKGVKYFS